MNQYVAKRRDFEARVLPHLEHLYHATLYVSTNESDARELVEETLARAYHAWLKSQVNSNGHVWLFRTMANALTGRYRLSPGPATAKDSTESIDRSSMHLRLANELSVDDSSQIPLSAISGDDIKEAIGNLHDDFKLIVVLSLLEGFSYQEIAEITSLPLKAVRFRLHQGRRLMHRELFDHVVREGNNGISEGRVRSA